MNIALLRHLDVDGRLPTDNILNEAEDMRERAIRSLTSSVVSTAITMLLACCVSISMLIEEEANLTVKCHLFVSVAVPHLEDVGEDLTDRCGRIVLIRCCLAWKPNHSANNAAGSGQSRQIFGCQSASSTDNEGTRSTKSKAMGEWKKKARVGALTIRCANTWSKHTEFTTECRMQGRGKPVGVWPR